MNPKPKQHSGIKTKHLRSLVQGVVQGFEWLEILGFTVYLHRVLSIYNFGETLAKVMCRSFTSLRWHFPIVGTKWQKYWQQLCHDDILDTLYYNHILRFEVSNLSNSGKCWNFREVSNFSVILEEFYIFGADSFG